MKGFESATTPTAGQNSKSQTVSQYHILVGMAKTSSCLKELKEAGAVILLITFISFTSLTSAMTHRPWKMTRNYLKRKRIVNPVAPTSCYDRGAWPAAWGML